MIEIVNENQKNSECEEMIMKVLWEAEKDLNLIAINEKVRIRFVSTKQLDLGLLAFYNLYISFMLCIVI